MERYRALLAFVRREGHARVPLGHREAGLALGTWVRAQQALYRNGALTPERASLLRTLPDWVWRLGPTFPRHRREKMLRLLRVYAKREGHARVPQQHRERGVPLGLWVVRQRKAYARGRLDARQVSDLETIRGWSWTARPVRRRSFPEMLRLLKQYARREGSALVPQDHVEAGAPLGRWVRSRRAARASGSLPSLQAAALERVRGWSWRLKTSKHRPLEQLLQALRRFVTRVGHARVPALHREGVVRLGSWVNSVRVDRKRGRLDPALARRLERFPGWSWDVYGDGFEHSLSLLRRYVRREGHARVPYRHVEAGVRLGWWVTGRRAAFSAKRIPAAQVAALEAVPTWTWSIQPPYSSRDMLAALLKFARREGHSRVPARHREGRLALGQWVASQRQARRRGVLPSHLARDLERIAGWTWSPLADRFSAMLSLLRRYVAREGHTRVPQRHLETGKKLGKWVADRRRAYREGEIPEEQIPQLESLPGWCWNVESGP